MHEKGIETCILILIKLFTWNNLSPGLVGWFCCVEHVPELRAGFCPSELWLI
jgi:hypothetical protein